MYSRRRVTRSLGNLAKSEPTLMLKYLGREEEWRLRSGAKGVHWSKHYPLPTKNSGRSWVETGGKRRAILGIIPTKSRQVSKTSL